MIKIAKNKEPKEWTEYRNTPGVDYQSIPELVESLLKEQGYICAYCMRRIPHRDKLYKKDGIKYVLTDEAHRIEHVLSRDNHPDKKLDYNNMVVCCPGHIGDEDHCDRLKGSNDISFSPLDSVFISTLSYKTDGEIVSSEQKYNKEINEVLNLNTPLLKQNRKESWESVKRELITIKKSNAWSKALIEKYIQKYRSMHINKEGKSQYIPYCGIVVYNLQKKYRQIQ